MQKIERKQTVMWFFIFTILYMLTGIVGSQFHASVGLAMVIISGYFICRKGGIRELLIIQLPIIVVVIGLIFFNGLYSNSMLPVCSLLSIIVIICIEKIVVYRVKVAYLVVLFTLPAAAYFAKNEWMYYKTTTRFDKEQQIDFPDIALTDIERSSFVFPMDNKLYVVDVWATNCGICLRKMKEMEILETKLKANTKLHFFILNLPLARDSFGYAKSVLAKRNINLPELYATDTSAWGKLGIEGVPVYYFIVNNKIVEIHDGGGIEVLHSPFNKSIEDDIEAALKSL
jgi:hypothetical protein